MLQQRYHYGCFRAVICGAALCILASVLGIQAADGVVPYSLLQTWLTKKGGKIHPRIVVCHGVYGAGLCLHPLPEARAALVKEPLWQDDNDVLIAVPRHLMITTRAAIQASTVAATILHAWHPHNVPYEAIHRKLQEVILAVFILEEKAKGSASKWVPYIEVLPNKTSLYKQLPVLWTHEEWETGLSRSHMVEILSTLRSIMEHSYKHAVCSVLPKFCNQFKLQDYLWASPRL